MYDDKIRQAASSAVRAVEIMYKLVKKSKYIRKKAWQRSSRNHPVGSHCRHARTYKKLGRRYKGGK